MKLLRLRKEKMNSALILHFERCSVEYNTVRRVFMQNENEIKIAFLLLRSRQFTNSITYRCIKRRRCVDYESGRTAKQTLLAKELNELLPAVSGDKTRYLGSFLERKKMFTLNWKKNTPLNCFFADSLHFQIILH